MDLHEQAGLVRAGVNDEGEQEWMGTDERWKEYERLLEESQKEPL